MPDGERTVSLTVQQALKVLGSQIVQIIKASPQSSLRLSDLPKIYLREFGFPFKPQMYECNSISEVISRLGDYVQVRKYRNTFLLSRSYYQNWSVDGSH